MYNACITKLTSHFVSKFKTGNETFDSNFDVSMIFKYRYSIIDCDQLWRKGVNSNLCVELHGGIGENCG